VEAGQDLGEARGEQVEVDITNRWSSPPGDRRSHPNWVMVEVDRRPARSVHQLEGDVEDGDAGGGSTSSPLRRRWIDPLR